ncbi:MAG: hypothetical protein K2K41_02005 [Ruminiclostridium sp.]|nr:hypothetical protein [Ruminiclostridium sp.]
MINYENKFSQTIKRTFGEYQDVKGVGILSNSNESKRKDKAPNQYLSM